MKPENKFTAEELQLLKSLCCKSGNFELASKVRQMEQRLLKLPKDKKVYVKAAKMGKWTYLNTTTDSW